MRSLFAVLCGWLGRALGDGESPSASRLIAVPCVMIVVLVPVLVWAWISLREGHLQEFPGSMIGFIGTLLTPLLTFLHWQKKEETKQSPAGDPTP